MRYLPRVAVLVIIGLTVLVPGTQAATSSHAAAAACPAKGTVSFMFWGDKGEFAEQSAVVKQAEAACPGLQVALDWDQGNYDNDLATKIGSGNAPDVFQLDGSKRLPEYVSEGALLDLTSYIKQDNLNLSSLFYPACLPETMYGGHTYGLERDCGNQGMLVFNKDMFDARHVAYPTASWTYKDLLSAAEKLSGNYKLPTDTSSKLRFGIGINQADYYVNQYMWDWGGDWLSADLKSCTMTSTQSRAGLQWWHDLAWVHHGAPTPEQQKAVSPDPIGGFHDQRYAMAFVGPWALNYLLKPAAYLNTPPVPFHWGVTLNPSGPVSRLSLISSGIEVAAKHTKNPVAAYWLIKYLTLGSGTQLEALYGIGIPGNVAIAKTKDYTTEYQPNAATWLLGMAPSNGRAMRLVPQYDDFDDHMTAALLPFWAGTTSVDAATTNMCSSVKPYLL